MSDVPVSAETAETPSLGTGAHDQPVQANEFAAGAFSATAEQSVGLAVSHRESEGRKVAMGLSIE